jgi:hypothetical protein
VFVALGWAGVTVVFVVLALTGVTDVFVMLAWDKLAWVVLVVFVGETVVFVEFAVVLP